MPLSAQITHFGLVGSLGSLPPDRSGIGRLDRGLLRLMSSRLLGCDTPDGLRRIPGIGVCLFVCCVQGKEGGDLQDQQPVRVREVQARLRSPLTPWLGCLTPAHPAHSSSPANPGCLAFARSGYRRPLANCSRCSPFNQQRRVTPCRRSPVLRSARRRPCLQPELRCAVPPPSSSCGSVACLRMHPCTVTTRCARCKLGFVRTLHPVPTWRGACCKTRGCTDMGACLRSSVPPFLQ